MYFFAILCLPFCRKSLYYRANNFQQWHDNVRTHLTRFILHHAVIKLVICRSLFIFTMSIADNVWMQWQNQNTDNHPQTLLNVCAHREFPTWMAGLGWMESKGLMMFFTPFTRYTRISENRTLSSVATSARQASESPQVKVMAKLSGLRSMMPITNTFLPGLMPSLMCT